MNKIVNAISGGRMGDFLHQLYVPAVLYKTQNIKTNLFIANKGDTFSCGLDRTFNELYDIIKFQEYIHDFNIYDGSEIDYDLSEWRQNNSNIGWTDKLYYKYISNVKNCYYNFKIIEFNDIINDYKDALIINRSLDKRRQSSIAIQKDIIKYFTNVFFIFTDFEQYDQYPLKDFVQPLPVKSLYQMFQVINSCKLFMGNLSGPLAIAYCLRKNILCEFGYVDTESYGYETNYYSNISWYNNHEIYKSKELGGLIKNG